MTAAKNTQDLMAHFSDPEAVARYAEGPPRFVPGFADLHRMTGLLLAEQAPADAHVLVLGAGGGLEIKALADAYPGWTFVGVDPSAEMLKLAERTLGPRMSRVKLVHGYIEDAPAGPFDAATCLLTLHFLEREARQKTVAAVHRRLKSGAPFVAAHSSFPQSQGQRGVWLARYAAYAVASGADPSQVDTMKAAVDSNLAIYSPEEDEEIIQNAGFSRVTQFYAAFTWRGWVATA